MRLPLSLLREWVALPWDTAELARRLTQAGFEIEAIETAAPAFQGVVVARILSTEPHPQAPRLQICRVLTAPDAPPLQIICGAANARAGLVSALARMGAVLPGNVVIEAAARRGVVSEGMLCSASELGMAESAEGIIELPADTPLGADLRVALDLDDTILDVNVTPNRGDALSVLGIAREVAALAALPLLRPALGVAGAGAAAAPAAAASDGATLRVSLQSGSGAGRLLVGVVSGVDNTRATPFWLRERLRRAGLRSISPVVDVTNYVMLELGQPMHAYDRVLLHGGLTARRAHDKEHLVLLDGRDVELTEDALVIADEQGAVGLAGIMGGLRSAITRETRAVALEAAWFAPAAIAGRARRYGLHTEGAQRFERGVDPSLQPRALQLATDLIVQLVGGQAGVAISAELPAELPRTPAVTLRAKRVAHLLGASVASASIEQRLRALDFRLETTAPGVWRVEPPAWRFDIGIEADLIEEVARIGGLDLIPEQDAPLPVMPRAVDSSLIDARVVLRTLVARGYQEIVTYAFVDPELQRTLFGAQPAIELANPIAAELAVMRSSLWPGLLRVARENLRRQQERLRLFEIASRYTQDDAGRYHEPQMLAGLVLGARSTEQWGSAATAADFYDLKGDLQALLSLGGAAAEFVFEPGAAACLHPGRSARVLRSGVEIGQLGELHPSLVRALQFTAAPILFEIDYAAAFRTKLAQFREISRFPQIRRDISLTVPESIAFRRIGERVSVAAGGLLKELRVFDVYQGKEVETGRKSIALGLILQDLNRTLRDEDADRVVEAVRAELQSNLDARIRE